VLYIGIYKFMDWVFPATTGYFIIYNLPRNLGIADIVPPHILVRDFFFNFGGLHFFILILFLSGLWRRYKGPMLYINLIIILYVLSVLVNFSIEEIRNYIAIIPFVLITALLFLSTFQNSFLKPTDKVLSGGKQN
ncbi:MAG TPA: hypothetical protein VGK25_12170, partial [Ignavibacteria bacterium]